MMLAAKSDNVEAVVKLLDHILDDGGENFTIDNEMATPTKSVKQLADEGAGIIFANEVVMVLDQNCMKSPKLLNVKETDSQNQDGINALMLAVQSHALKAIEQLLKIKANVDHKAKVCLIRI